MSTRSHKPGVIGRNLRRIRESKKMSRPALAEASGISVPTISELELGYRDNPTQETVRRLAKGLGVPPQMLSTEAGVADLRPLVKAFLESDLAKAIPGGTPDIEDPDIKEILALPAATWEHLPPTPTTIYYLLMAYRAQR